MTYDEITKGANFDDGIIETPVTSNANPMPRVSSEESEKENNSKKGKRVEVDLNMLANFLIKNFEKLNKEKRVTFITNLIGTSPSGLAKIFKMNPGSRILQSVRGERPLQENVVKQLVDYVKNSEIMKRYPKLSEKIDNDLFVSEKIAKTKKSDVVLLKQSDVDLIKNMISDSELQALSNNMFK